MRLIKKRIECGFFLLQTLMVGGSTFRRRKTKQQQLGKREHPISFKHLCQHSHDANQRNSCWMDHSNVIFYAKFLPNHRMHAGYTLNSFAVSMDVRSIAFLCKEN